MLSRVLNKWKIFTSHNGLTMNMSTTNNQSEPSIWSCDSVSSNKKVYIMNMCQLHLSIIDQGFPASGQCQVPATEYSDNIIRTSSQYASTLCHCDIEFHQKFADQLSLQC